ncbi:MAG: Zn-ribbon domain-containing OB-fold protein [Halanaeroarchaeum sp.]
MSLLAHRCENGHLTHPEHRRCPECGEPQVETVDLTDRTGTVVTWTTSTATPPGVRQPNTLAIVEFEVEDETVSVVGQVRDGEPTVGDRVEPVYAEELRDPTAGIREGASQDWDGYRFAVVD